MGVYQAIGNMISVEMMIKGYLIKGYPKSIKKFDIRHQNLLSKYSVVVQTTKSNNWKASKKYGLKLGIKITSVKMLIIDEESCWSFCLIDYLPKDPNLYNLINRKEKSLIYVNVVVTYLT